jgi:two-component system LytT family sensor kinase
MSPRLASAWLPQDTVLFAQLAGYGFSVVLAVLLAALVWRDAGVGWRARVLFAVCGLAWTLGGLKQFALQAAGVPDSSAVAAWTLCVTYGAASVWPLALPLLWETHAKLSRREAAASAWLVRLATVTAIALIIGFVLATHGFAIGISDQALRILVAYNAAVVLAAATALVFRHLETRLERVAVLMMPLGPVLTILGHHAQAAGFLPAQLSAWAGVAAKQSILLTIIGALFYLGRFRGLDRFAKRALHIKAAALHALLVAWLVFGPLTHLAERSAAPRVVLLATAVGVITTALFLFVRIAHASDRWVDRFVFRRIDPASALAAFRERLTREETATSVIAAAERFARETLRLDARLVARPSATASPSLAAAATGMAAASAGLPATRPRIAWCGGGDAPLESFPVHVGESEPLMLELNSGDRRLLVTAEIELARQTAHWVGRRLEALERERERLERSRREASLVHQLVEAELRALRAQINPHFLFNSLNTIAALVHDQPQVAEQMTVRLARIFRHVLKQTERPFSSLQEEMDFLRAYLDIEQIRFGERLEIDFRIAASVAESQVPSLILQPLVENAIKHGLAPKLGECRLIISGSRDDEHVLLSVEDNGVGTSNGGTAADAGSSGIGLRNVRERLRTLYGEQARLQFESELRRGSRAAVYLPLAAASREVVVPVLSGSSSLVSARP